MSESVKCNYPERECVVLMTVVPFRVCYSGEHDEEIVKKSPVPYVTCPQERPTVHYLESDQCSSYSIALRFISVLSTYT
jgi:hypothetical protein